MKKILYFSKTDRTGPSSRYRIYQFLEGLEEAGIMVKVSPLFGRAYFRLVEWPALFRIPGKILYTVWRFFVRALGLLSAGRYDAVVIEHQLFPYLPPIAERLLRASKKPIALEFDDAIYLTRFHGRKMAALVGLADRVIVGNRFLASFAEGKGARAVSVVPTVLDMGKYPPMREYASRKGPFVVGWVGLRYNFPFLESLKPVLPKGAVLRVVSSSRPKIEGVPLEFISWTEEREAEIIAGFDVGVMPLPDTEWARGKCGLKILQYMAAGVPVVASPVGVNRDIIRDGENGFLAATAEEWSEKIRRLQESEALREKMGRAGRNSVEEAYALEGGLELLIDIYRKI